MRELGNNSSMEKVCAAMRRQLPMMMSGFDFAPDMLLRFLYSIVIVLSIPLNLAVITAFMKKAMKKSPLKSLLQSLVLADLFTALGMCPYILVTPKNLAAYSQNVADFLCTITFGQSLFWIGNSASVFTLCIISVHRYLVINHGTRPWIFVVKKRKHAIGASVFVWILGALLVIPNFFSRHFDPCFRVCRRQWPKGFDGGAYAITTTFIGYINPVLILFYTFCTTVYTMWFKKTTPGSDQGKRKYRRRVVKLLGILIFVFSVCWSPFAVYWILSRATRVFPDGIQGHYARTRVNHVMILVALCNSVINPLVYGISSPGIKAAIWNSLSSPLKSRTQQTYEI